MKIVKDKVWWEFTCKACGCHCETEPNDVIALPDPDADGMLFYEYVVECGKCGKEHKVPDGKLTDKVMKIGKRRRRR